MVHWRGISLLLWGGAPGLCARRIGGMLLVVVGSCVGVGGILDGEVGGILSVRGHVLGGGGTGIKHQAARRATKRFLRHRKMTTVFNPKYTGGTEGIVLFLFFSVNFVCSVVLLGGAGQLGLGRIGGVFLWKDLDLGASIEGDGVMRS